MSAAPTIAIAITVTIAVAVVITAFAFAVAVVGCCVPSFPLHLAKLSTMKKMSRHGILGQEAWRIGGSTDGGQNAIMMAIGNGKQRERREVRCCGLCCFSNESLPLSSLAREGEGGAGDIFSPHNKIGGN